MVSIKLTKNLYQKLYALSKNKYAKGFYIKKAFSKYLDRLDLYISLKRISNPNRKTITTEELVKIIL